MHVCHHSVLVLRPSFFWNVPLGIACAAESLRYALSWCSARYCNDTKRQIGLEYGLAWVGLEWISSVASSIDSTWIRFLLMRLTKRVFETIRCLGEKPYVRLWSSLLSTKRVIIILQRNRSTLSIFHHRTRNCSLQSEEAIVSGNLFLIDRTWTLWIPSHVHVKR